jgi:hypothetical protein
MECSSCIFWDGLAFDEGKRRICSKLTGQMFDDDVLITAATGDESDPFISTAWNFGCTLFSLNADAVGVSNG